MGPMKLPSKPSAFAITPNYRNSEAALFHPAGQRNARPRRRVVTLGWRYDIR